MDAGGARRFILKSLAGDSRVLLVERRLAERRPQKTRHRYDRPARCRSYACVPRRIRPTPRQNSGDANLNDEARMTKHESLFVISSFARHDRTSGRYSDMVKVDIE